MDLRRRPVMKRLVIAIVMLILVFGGTAAHDEQDPDPVEILKKADAAIKEVSGVAYTAKSTPTGIAENFVSAAEGEAVVIGWRDDWGQPEKYYVHITTTQQGSDEPLELTGGGNGEMFFLIDHSAKKAYEDMDPNVMGSSGNTLQGFGMREFVHDHPFDDEINAETVTYEGIETVNGEECHKILVEYPQPNQKSTWFFDTDDYLPRRRVQHFSMGDRGEGTIAIEIVKLEINPEVDASTFVLKLPEGYEQIDDFAP
jgi:outer membrane lipoprotein-sorting protein